MFLACELVMVQLKTANKNFFGPFSLEIVSWCLQLCQKKRQPPCFLIQSTLNSCRLERSTCTTPPIQTTTNHWQEQEINEQLFTCTRRHRMVLKSILEVCFSFCFFLLQRLAGSCQLFVVSHINHFLKTYEMRPGF